MKADRDQEERGCCHPASNRHPGHPSCSAVKATSKPLAITLASPVRKPPNDICYTVFCAVTLKLFLRYPTAYRCEIRQMPSSPPPPDAQWPFLCHWSTTCAATKSPAVTRQAATAAAAADGTAAAGFGPPFGTNSGGLGHPVSPSSPCGPAQSDGNTGVLVPRSRVTTLRVAVTAPKKRFWRSLNYAIEMAYASPVACHTT